MIRTAEIVESLSQRFGPDGAREMAAVLENFYEDIQQTLFHQEFAEIRSSLRELVEAQKRTEQRLEELTITVHELAQVVRSHDIRLAKLDGRTLESEVREKGRKLQPIWDLSCAEHVNWYEALAAA